jgi:hypothetical protein
MSLEEALFFAKQPKAMPLYQAFVDRLYSEFVGVKISVKKTQISFSNKYIFAAVSMPLRKIKGHTGIYILVTFGLNHRVEHPRIMEAVEPYPNRWTHHVPVTQESDVDDVLMDWIKSAYAFSMMK